MPENNKQKAAFGLLLMTIALAAFMSSLDATIVNIALPTISTDFGISSGTVAWVSLAYLIILSSFMLAFGKIADNKGYKKIFIAGFAVFTLGSLLCGIMPFLFENFWYLVFFRVIQAIGASMLSGLGAGMVAVYLPADLRGRGLAVSTVMASIGLAAGPFLGGIFTQYAGWHWIFLVNIPVGILGIIMGLRHLPPDKKAPGKFIFDYAGSILVFLCIASGIFALNMGAEKGWASPFILGSFVFCAISFLLFIINEKRHVNPLLDLSIFKNRNFSFANASAAIIMLLFTGATFLFPFYLEYVKEFPPAVSGIILVVPSIAMIIAGPVAGIISDRSGSRNICTVSSVICGISFLMFSMLDSSSSLPFLVAGLGMMGFSAGLFIPANSNLIFSYTKREDSGIISSLMMTVRDTGASVGVAVFETIFAAIIYAEIAAYHITSTAPVEIKRGLLVSGFQLTFLSAAVICIVAIAFSYFAKDREKI
ncbi:MFS transporter [Methanoplanus sp. FWC-SCC4]|uniref:MFS transporter n=1 Tax=Methanochimaera problematica TaxID=2609417 RepID=A0AA97FE27_9EURY|nr:MFS transporter [Methanoplanus sp. FWC-SCC4]WOF17157.1 MFS transporter [Methanoplanus sp. FWC-SCC4]